MDSQLRQRLLNLQQSCQTLSSAGKYAECIEIMEEILGIKRQVYGMGHVEFQKSSQKLCEYLNLAAMILLQKQKFEQCLDYLRKAELVSRNSIQLKSTTYNNLACYYRRTGKIRTALTYLIQALEMQLKLEQPKTLADTHLNLCAVLSQLDRHDDALQHSMLSIILLQDQFLMKLLDSRNQVASQREDEKIDDQRLAVLAIAYHNMGVEFQHLKRFQQAVKIYKKALNLSKTYISDNEQLILNLNKVVQSATQQIQDKKKANHQLRKLSMDRQFSQTKHNIYKQFAKNSQRLSKNLPKLKFNRDMFELKNKYESSSSNPVHFLQSKQSIYQSRGAQSRHESRQRQSRYDSKEKDDSLIDRVSRTFASRKHPRYFKSYGITYQNDNNKNLASQPNSERNQDNIQSVSQNNDGYDPI